MQSLLRSKPPLGFTSIDQSRSLAQGLVGLWLFNEYGGGQIHNLALPLQSPATFGNSPTWAVGERGTGVKFNGSNSYIAAPYVPQLNCTGGLTIEAMFFSGTATNVVVVGKPFAATHTSPFFDYSLYLTSTPNINFRIGTDTHNLGAWSTNTLYHIILTADGVNKRWWVNGVNTATQASVALPTNTNSQPLRFGANAVAGEAFGGTIFKVAIYNRALRPTEVLELYTDPYAMVYQPSKTAAASLAKPWLYRSHTQTLGAGFVRAA